MRLMANMLRYFFLLSAMSISLTSILVSADVGLSVSTQLNNVCIAIKAFVGILVVILLAIGAVLYAVSHVLPAAGNIKGNLQGWSLNMIVGAMVGLVIYFLAPYIATQITNFGSNGTVASVPTC